MKIDFNYNIDFKELKDIEKETIKVDDKSVLFIVDINNGFAKKGALASPRVEAIIPNIVEAVEVSRDANAEIIAFTDSHKKDSVEFNFYPEHCLDGDVESELVDELKVYEKYITLIKKSTTNAFLEEETQAKVNELVEKGIISG
ncbi:cysteine hydrolase [Clostridium gasigenes]|uniref:isochorismatase family protein n=1 Tax=Clostridium gasigenes TaxID=94869 RepID=UPI0014383B1E|nr:isochorismatase family protein [Clostridium gasigenes]NKF08850.1 cysteine hydrolase [Clostridium gasigenes]QSW21258.1 cysteine hydrolase [Clostridium gasigenes]